MSSPVFASPGWARLEPFTTRFQGMSSVGYALQQPLGEQTPGEAGTGCCCELVEPLQAVRHRRRWLTWVQFLPYLRMLDGIPGFRGLTLG